jgi:hypothetical protein
VLDDEHHDDGDSDGDENDDGDNDALPHSIPTSETKQVVPRQENN